MFRSIVSIFFLTFGIYSSLFLFPQIAAQDVNKKAEKIVALAPFVAHKSKESTEISQKIQAKIQAELEAQGFQVVKVTEKDLNSRLTEAQKKEANFLIEGFYRINNDGKVDMFVQIYNPEKKILIDAVNSTNQPAVLEGIVLDPVEMNKTESQILNEISKKIPLRLRSNPKKAERRDNITEFAIETGLVKEYNLPIEKEDLAKESEAVFKLLSEKEDVVVSVSKFAQKTSEAPADITVITREQIRANGYRNLSEALNIVPQVYSHWVGQNWGTDFRGLFVNNQIERRVLYLQDGKKLNDYFHFGEFYGDVFTDMERIEKIEVIKGPGAALYGNNSITGVVNVITRKPTKKNEMEFITEYDSVLRTVTGRALYYSKFSDKFSISFDASKFEGQGFYDSGYNSWGNTRFYDPRTGSTNGTSGYGRQVAPVHTGQTIWFSTGAYADKGKPFPNYNLDIKYGDWNLKSFYMSKDTSWVPPQFDGGGFGGDTVYGSKINNRVWGVGVLMLDYTPQYLEKYEASFRIFRQLGINSDYREKDFQGYSLSNPPPGINYGANSAARLTNPAYTQFIALSGGGLVKRYASTAWVDGTELQITPFRREGNKESLVKSLRFMVGGNYQNVKYINYQGVHTLNGYPINQQQGISDDGKQFGIWTQLSTTFKSETTLVLGLRYDAQKVYNVYRHQYGNGEDRAYESVTDPILKTPVTGGQPYVGPGSAVNLSTPVRDPAGNLTANGYVQPFQRKNFIAEDKTPRIALIQNFPSTNSTIKMLYAEAFRMVTPQELIRLPRDQGNAISEKVYNTEINIIQGFLRNSIVLNGDIFRMRGSTIYAFNAAQFAFSNTPGWENTGGSLAVTYRPDQKWRLGGSFTSYKLRRPSDVSFLNVLFTPSPQSLNSPTKLWKANISRSIISDQYTIALEFYYNNEIHLMQNPPATFEQTRNSDGSFRENMPLNAERTNASSYLGPGVGGGITRYRVWKVPESKFFNLTFSSNIGNDLILVISAKNIFNQKVFYPLDIESGTFTNPILSPNQLIGFGREVYMKLGYRF